MPGEGAEDGLIDDGSTDLDGTPTEGIDGPASGGLLAFGIGALPGDEEAARDQQRKRKLDELGERRHRPHDDRGPTLAMAAVRRQGLGPNGTDTDPTRQADRVERDLEEPRLLADRNNQQRLDSRQRRGQGRPGKPPPLPRSRMASDPRFSAAA